MLRVMDAPGYYAAFPWEATLGRRGRPERAATPLAHALYIPLSLPPASSTPGSFIRPRWLLTEKYTEGLHPERPARGAVLYTSQSRPCIEHKGPPSTKNMHQRRPPVVATIRLRRSSPRSRGPPSQSESYVWDKALICRRLGESNSSI